MTSPGKPVLPSIHSFLAATGQTPPMPIILPMPTIVQPEVQVPSTNPPVVVKPVSSTMPAPVVVMGPNKQQISMRCVCGETETNCLLVPCVKCGHHLHGKCVCVPRVKKYVCPFCAGKKLRCNCDQNMVYDVPIIQCSVCKFWVHKQCAGFLPGIIPDNFVCWGCSTGATYTLPKCRFSSDSQCKDFRTDIKCDRTAILSKLPDGEFRDQVAKSLDMSELDFRETMCTYVDIFLPCLFDFTKEFWKIFVGTLAELLSCDKKDILDAIDELVVNIFYKPRSSKNKECVGGLVVSDSIAADISSEKLPMLESLPESVPISLTDDFRVVVGREIESDNFICELPGLLCHEEDIQSSNGIPRAVIGIPETRIVLDVSRSSNPILKHIRRSFHFNCDVKLVRVGGVLKACLYGSKLRGILSSEKGPKKASIPENGEILLPLDVSLPFPIDKPFWKAKKVRPVAKTRASKPAPEKPHAEDPAPKTTDRRKKRAQAEPVKSMKTRARVGVATKSRTEFPFSLTLLSIFTEDACPPMHMVVNDEGEEEVDPDSLRGRIRQRHNKHLMTDLSE